MNEEAPRFTKTEFRQIKYLLYFVVFIVLFQVFQYVTTKRATQKYRELFSQATEVVVLTNSVSFQTASIHRAILNLTFSTDSADAQKFRESLIDSQEKVANDISLIEEKITSYDLYSFEKTVSFVSLKLANGEYKNRYQKYLAMLSTVSTNEQFNYRRKILRPALDRFQENQSNFLLKIFSDQQKTAENIAREADKTALQLLIGGNILLVLVAVILIYIILSERKKVV